MLMQFGQKTYLTDFEPLKENHLIILLSLKTAFNAVSISATLCLDFLITSSLCSFLSFISSTAHFKDLALRAMSFDLCSVTFLPLCKQAGFSFKDSW